MKDNKDNTNRKSSKSVNSVIWGEFLFVILPLLVTSMVFKFQGNFLNVFALPEWSFASAIMAGQAIIRFVSGLVSVSEKIEWRRVILPLSLLITCVLTPSLVILSLLLVSKNPSNSLITTQLVLFFIASITYLSYAGYGEELFQKSELRRSKK